MTKAMLLVDVQADALEHVCSFLSPSDNFAFRAVDSTSGHAWDPSHWPAPDIRMVGRPSGALNRSLARLEPLKTMIGSCPPPPCDTRVAPSEPPAFVRASGS